MLDVNTSHVNHSSTRIAGGALGRMHLPEDMVPVISHGSGARVWTVDGVEYLDCLMGSGPLILGHAHPAFVDAIREQVVRGSTFYALTPQILELADVLGEAIPCAEKVKFTSSGSEAMQYAVRLARGYTRRPKVLKFEGGYHGHGEPVVFSSSPTRLLPFPEAEPEGLGTTEGVRSDILIAPFNDLAEVGRILDSHAGEVACIVVEPVQRAIMPKPGFLSGLRALADRHGALLVFDEILTGFRMDYGGAQSFFSVTPDIAAFGKAMAGGYPIAAVVGREDVMNLVDPQNDTGTVVFSGTFNGHPLGAAAALATLTVLREDGVYPRLHELGRMLKDGVEGVLRTQGIAGSLLGGGPWFQLVLGEHEIVDYRTYKQSDLARTMAVNLDVIRKRILFNPSSKGYLSLAHTGLEIERIVDAYSEALAKPAQHQ